MTKLYGGALFLGAFLLFCSQPMIGKMMLPLLGGSASVWTAAMLFFQVALLAGYVYAYLLARIQHVAVQAAIHLTLMAVAALFLPFGFRAESVSSGVYAHPVFWEIASLVRAVGFPYIVVSTTAPLLQSWFHRMREQSSRDPYFLYAASNAGSLLGLAAYPLLIERELGARTQSMAWMAGYGVLFCAVLFAAWMLRKASARTAETDVADSAVVSRPDWPARARWLVAAFVPSGLLLAVTTHVSVNLTPMPLVWTIPLAVYLATFILAFGRRVRISSAQIVRLLPPLIVLLCPAVGLRVPVVFGIDVFLIGAHMILLFIAALACHAVLADSRPDVSRLTEYYVWIALGGALGGVFASLVAPALFTSVFEYPLLLAVAMFVRPPSKYGWIVSGGLAAMVLGYGILLPRYTLEEGVTLHVERNFFGVKRVVDVGRTRKLLHGDTLHGIEDRSADRIGKPMAYYEPDGAFGDVMRTLASPSSRVGVVGLGTGAIAAYAGADRHVTFFEIDPAVEPIARRYFTFLDACGGNCDVVAGDGRLAIAQYPEGTFDLLILDAFNSDAIPSHLLSREALALYRSRIKPDGLIFFHVSNRYLKVRELVATLAADAGMPALTRTDEIGPPLKSRAMFVIVARTDSGFGPLASGHLWQPAEREPGLNVWTDDRSDIAGLLRWER